VRPPAQYPTVGTVVEVVYLSARDKTWQGKYIAHVVDDRYPDYALSLGDLRIPWHQILYFAPYDVEKHYRKAVKAELKELDVWDYVSKAYPRKWLNKHIAAFMAEPDSDPATTAMAIADLADAY